MRIEKFDGKLIITIEPLPTVTFEDAVRYMNLCWGWRVFNSTVLTLATADGWLWLYKEEQQLSETVDARFNIYRLECDGSYKLLYENLARQQIVQLLAKRREQAIKEST